MTRKKSNFKMEDSTFIIIQLFVVLTVIAGDLDIGVQSVVEYFSLSKIWTSEIFINPKSIERFL